MKNLLEASLFFIGYCVTCAIILVLGASSELWRKFLKAEKRQLRAEWKGMMRGLLM